MIAYTFCPREVGLASNPFGPPVFPRTHAIPRENGWYFIGTYLSPPEQVEEPRVVRSNRGGLDARLFRVAFLRPATPRGRTRCDVVDRGGISRGHSGLCRSTRPEPGRADCGAPLPGAPPARARSC